MTKPSVECFEPRLNESLHQPSLEHRAWDSEHFGFSVVSIPKPLLDAQALEAVLHAAREQQIQLVYWASRAELPADCELLAEYNGLLADRKTAYFKTLAPRQAGGGADDLILRQVAPGEESPALLELGIAAGQGSRFALDPRIPRVKFRALYEIWMRRSIARELAATVLVVEDRPAPLPLGVVTISLHAGVGQIGLLAVAERQRGRGIGRRLLDAAERWMLGHGANAARVVTQRDNAAACRLYERGGYSLEKLEYLYHFWPQE